MKISFLKLQSTSDCVPFEEGLQEPQEEEPLKTLLEVSTETDLRLSDGLHLVTYLILGRSFCMTLCYFVIPSLFLFIARFIKRR